jgi:hypothetical protein
MKKIIGFVLFFMFITSSVFAWDYTTVTFTQTSSAKTSAFNLRIAKMTGTLARDRDIPIQAMALSSITGYYLTKSTTVTLDSTVKGLYIQADQDTKVYFGSDLTNWVKIYADIPFSLIRK